MLPERALLTIFLAPWPITAVSARPTCLSGVTLHGARHVQPSHPERGGPHATPIHRDRQEVTP